MLYDNRPQVRGKKHINIKARRRAWLRQIFKATRKCGAWRGGVMYFIDFWGKIEKKVPGVPALPKPGKKAIGAKVGDTVGKPTKVWTPPPPEVPSWMRPTGWDPHW